MHLFDKNNHDASENMCVLMMLKLYVASYAKINGS